MPSQVISVGLIVEICLANECQVGGVPLRAALDRIVLVRVSDVRRVRVSPPARGVVATVYFVDRLADPFFRRDQARLVLVRSKG